MNWDALGAIGNLLAAIGVIVSLIYLAVQIRQNSILTKASIKHSLASQTQISSQSWAEHAEAVMRVVEKNNPSTSDEFVTQQLLQANFRSYENYLYQYKIGLFDESEWIGIKQTMYRQLSYPQVASWWMSSKSEFSDDLCELLDEHCGQSEDS